MLRHSLLPVILFLLALPMTAVSPAMAQPATTAPAMQPPPGENDPNKMADQAIALLDSNEKDAKDAAAQLFTKIKDMSPRLDRLNLVAAKLTAAEGDYTRALIYYDQYSKTMEGKNDYRPYAAMGRLYMRSKTYRQARRNLEQARLFAPEQDAKGRYLRAEIMSDLAGVLHVLDDNKEAVRVGREAATQASRDAKIQVQFSRLLLAINPTETKEARDVAAKAVVMLNDDIAADSFSESKLRLLAEALSVVVSTWANDVVAQKENPEPVYMLSIATHDVAEVNMRIALLAAREYAERAVTLNDAKPEYRIRLAEIEALLGSTRTALEKLDAVLKTEPENAAALALKARIAAAPARKVGGAAGQ